MRIVFSEEYPDYALVERDGDERQVPLPPEDLDLALELLKRLNRWTFADGRRASEYVIVDGFEPWWFRQERVYWYILVPYTRYRALINLLAAEGQKVTIVNAPPKVRSLVGLLHESGAGVSVAFEGQGCDSRGVVWRQRLTWGLIEAAKLLVTVLSLLVFRLSRPQVLLYAIDKVSPRLRHDFRLHNIYRKLGDEELSFAEYLHSLDNVTALRNLVRRRRPVVFFETVASLLYRLRRRRWADRHPLPAVRSGEEEPDAAFLAGVARQGLELSLRSAVQIQCLKWVIRWHRPRRAVIPDDCRHVNELIAACKSLGVPTLGYMHGLFNRYHTGLMAYGFDAARRHTFDLYGVWGPYFRQYLLAGDLYDESNTFVCGPLRPPAEQELQAVLSARRRNASPVRVLLISESRARHEEVARYIEELAADGRFRVMLKLRPGEEHTFLDRVVDSAPGAMQMIRGGTVYEAFSQADVVLGTYSTTLYEAVLALVPVVVVNTSFTYGHDIARDGLAEFAESPESVCDVVLRAAKLSQEELIWRRNAIWGEGLTDGATTLFDVAQDRLWEKAAR